MESSPALFLSGVVSLVVLLLSLNALLSCARELKAIRSHLDKLAPEALLSLKTTRRAGGESH